MRSGTTLVEGVVVDTDDPQQMGRIKVWCPGIDGETYIVEDLPWATYLSPLAGHAFDRPAGANAEKISGPVAYGWWAIPKKGATVVVGFLYGDYNLRFYLGSYFPEHSTRSLPTGRNSAGGPTTDTNKPLEPALGNLKAQFQGKLSAPEAQTRGVYERMAAQPKTIKDGAEGYQPDITTQNATDLDPQTYCFVTPGRHALIFQDHPSTARVRLKTADGSQVILDDANERIYISTSKGRTWVELDADGRVHIYAADDIAVSSGGSISISAKGDFSVSAGGNINLGASGSILASACKSFGATGDGGVNITSGGGMDLLASSKMLLSGSTIDLNGPKAKAAECAEPAKVVPQHEPWTRAASKQPRNKNWKP
jgi:hypothetical protein